MRHSDINEFSITQKSLFPLDSPLALLKNFFLWESLRPTIKEIAIVFYNSSLSFRNIDFVLILKVLILQSFYKIVDDNIDEEIKNRMSFLGFLDLQLGETVPKVNVIKLFRDELAEKKLLNQLFKQINNVLIKKTTIISDTRSSPVVTPSSSLTDNRHQNSIERKAIQHNKKASTVKTHGRVGIHWMKIRVKRKQLINHQHKQKQRLLPHFSDSGDIRSPNKQDKKSSNNSNNTQLVNENDDNLDVKNEKPIICTELINSKQLANAQNKQLQNKSLLIIKNYRRKKIRTRIEPFFGYQISAYRNKLIRMYWMTRARATIRAKSVAYNLKRYLH